MPTLTAALLPFTIPLATRIQDALKDTSPATDSHLLVWEDGATHQKCYYRYSLYDVSGTDKHKMWLTEAKWKVADEQMLATLQSINVADAQFHSGIAHFTVEANGTTCSKVTYQNSNDASSPKPIDTTHQIIPVAAKQFYQTVLVDLKPKLGPKEGSPLAAQYTPPRPCPTAIAAASLNPTVFQTNAPVGSKNETDTCFLNALEQAFILQYPELMPVLWAERIEGNSAEFGRHLDTLQTAVTTSHQPALGIGNLRTALVRLQPPSPNQSFAAGEHDPIEAMCAVMQGNILTSLSRGSHLRTKTTRTYFTAPDLHGREFEKLKRGASPTEFYEEDTDSSDWGHIHELEITGSSSLSALLNQSLIAESSRDTTPTQRDLKPISTPTLVSSAPCTPTHRKTTTWDTAPEHLFISLNRNNATNKDNTEVTVTADLTLPAGTITATPTVAPKYTLRSFAVHKGSATTTGHYVAYVRHDDDTCYLIDDGTTTPMTLVAFLDAAKLASHVMYNLAPSASATTLPALSSSTTATSSATLAATTSSSSPTLPPVPDSELASSSTTLPASSSSADATASTLAAVSSSSSAAVSVERPLSPVFSTPLSSRASSPTPKATTSSAETVD